MTMIMGLEVEFPIVIHCDNVGSLYLDKNSENKQTKYLYTKFHFFREYFIDGIVSVVIISLKENKSDPFKKNMTQEFVKKFFD